MESPGALSAAEKVILRRIKRAKLFGFLRRKRHELFDAALDSRPWRVLTAAWYWRRIIDFYQGHGFWMGYAELYR